MDLHEGSLKRISGPSYDEVPLQKPPGAYRTALSSTVQSRYRVVEKR